jgi:hypothetical protein
VEYVPGKFGQALGLENDFAYIVVENNADIKLKSAEIGNLVKGLTAVSLSGKLAVTWGEIKE